MGCKDKVVGKILKSLLSTGEINLGLIFSKSDALIAESDPFLYFKLSEQFLREKKGTIALEVIWI